MHRTNIPRVDLDAEQEAELVARWRSGDRVAGNTLACAAAGVVGYVVSRYAAVAANRGGKAGFDTLELESWAWLGVAQALTKYDPTKGRLFAYCRSAVAREVKEAIGTHSKAITLPADAGMVARFFFRTGETDPVKLAKMSGASEDVARSTLAVVQPWDASFDDEDSGLEKRMSVDTHGHDPAARVIVEDLLPAVKSPLTREFLRRHYVYGQDYAEIGADHGMSRQAAEQRIKDGLAAMRRRAQRPALRAAQ